MKSKKELAEAVLNLFNDHELELLHEGLKLLKERRNDLKANEPTFEHYVKSNYETDTELYYFLRENENDEKALGELLVKDIENLRSKLSCPISVRLEYRMKYGSP